MPEQVPGIKKGVDHIGVTVSYFCHDGEGNYILAKRGTNCRDEHGRWDFGGGGMEFGETPEGTLKREVEEEYGTPPVSFEPLGFRSVLREQDGKSTHWVSLDYKVLIDRAKVRNAEPHKHDEIGWFRLDALPSPLHSATAHEMAFYGERLAR